MVQFLKCVDVKSPERKYGDSGIDFFVPNDVEYLKGNKCGEGYDKADPVVVKNEDGTPVDNPWVETEKGWAISVPPRGSVLIPLGIMYITKDPSVHLYICNKSGKSTKNGWIIGACLCDHSYENVAHAHLISTRSVPTFIEPGEKIVQAMLITSHPDEILTLEPGEISKKEFFKYHMKNRGDLGFGQGTGK